MTRFLGYHVCVRCLNWLWWSFRNYCSWNRRRSRCTLLAPLTSQRALDSGADKVEQMAIDLVGLFVVRAVTGLHLGDGDIFGRSSHQAIAAPVGIIKWVQHTLQNENRFLELVNTPIEGHRRR